MATPGIPPLSFAASSTAAADSRYAGTFDNSDFNVTFNRGGGVSAPVLLLIGAAAAWLLLRKG